MLWKQNKKMKGFNFIMLINAKVSQVVRGLSNFNDPNDPINPKNCNKKARLPNGNLAYYYSCGKIMLYQLNQAR